MATTNTRRAPVAIEAMEPRRLFAVADLTEVITNQPFAATLQSDVRSRGTAVVQITNPAEDLPRSRVFVEVYASQTPLSVTGRQDDDFYLGIRRFRTELTSGATTAVNVPVSILRNELASGTYTLYAVVGQGFDTTNVSVATTGPTVTLVAPYPDLRPVAGEFVGLPNSATPGGAVRAIDRVTILNRGTGASFGPVTVNVSLSAVGTTANGVVIATRSVYRRIAVGRAIRVNVPVRQVSPLLAPGTYSVVTQVVDADGYTAELIGPSITIV